MKGQNWKNTKMLGAPSNTHPLFYIETFKGGHVYPGLFGPVLQRAVTYWYTYLICMLNLSLFMFNA